MPVRPRIRLHVEEPPERGRVREPRHGGREVRIALGRRRPVDGETGQAVAGAKDWSISSSIVAGGVSPALS